MPPGRLSRTADRKAAGPSRSALPLISTTTCSRLSAPPEIADAVSRETRFRWPDATVSFEGGWEFAPGLDRAWHRSATDRAYVSSTGHPAVALRPIAG